MVGKESKLSNIPFNLLPRRDFDTSITDTWLLNEKTVTDKGDCSAPYCCICKINMYYSGQDKEYGVPFLMQTLSLFSL